MLGGGKYEEATTQARLSTGAAGVILIIFGGAQGHGFSVQAPPGLVPTIPGILRKVAEQIERDLGGNGG